MENSGEPLLSGYPNINNQTIPDEIELGRLLNIISRHKRTVQDMGPMLRTARQNLDDFLRSSEDQRNVPEATIVNLEIISKIGAIKEHIKQLCLGALRATKDLKQLQGSMHPIRRCPTDILQDIFEWVAMTESYRARFQSGINLSHVCYRWHKIAVQTPNLWTHLCVSLETPPRDVESIWTQTIERMKTCRATVSIENISDDGFAWEGMKKCRLDLIPNLQVLKLWISTNDAARRLAAGEFYPPQSSFETLEIGSNWDDMVWSKSIEVDFSHILNQFPTFEKVVLEDFDCMDFTITATFPIVSELTIRKCKSVFLTLLARAFPNTKTVRFDSSEVYNNEDEDINWPNIETFEAVSTGGILECNLKMPKITHLDMLAMPVWENGFGTFIRSHPSLQHLHTRYSYGSYSDIASGAPQLVCLSMPAEEAGAALEFANLVYLQLFQTRSSDLSSEVFDSIARKFFLPPKPVSTNPTSLKKHHRDPSLTILVPIEDNFMLTWRGFSVLIRQAIEETSVEHMWGSLYRAYSFKWS